MTMLLIGRPITFINANDNRNEDGMAMPTSRAERNPSVASTTIITRMIAVKTELSSCSIMPLTGTDSSIDIST